VRPFALLKGDIEAWLRLVAGAGVGVCVAAGEGPGANLCGVFDVVKEGVCVEGVAEGGAGFERAFRGVGEGREEGAVGAFQLGDDVADGEGRFSGRLDAVELVGVVRGVRDAGEQGGGCPALP